MSSSSSDGNLVYEAKRALSYLQIYRKYRYIEFLDEGGYGWVALMYDDAESKLLAIKCTDDPGEMEVKKWPLLKHPNIVPLLEIIDLENCTVFIMPSFRKDLYRHTTSSSFYTEDLSFGMCRIWLRDVASALVYLHSLSLCHLDMKLDNVFLGDDGHASLADFSFLSDINQVSFRIRLHELQQPPDYNSNIEEDESCLKSRGDQADMWQFGILAIDLLTNLKLSEDKTSSFPLWEFDVKPFIQKLLTRDDYLRYLLEECFENIDFTENEVLMCSDFFHKLLDFNPETRMSAEEALHHPLLNVTWPQIYCESRLVPRLSQDLTYMAANQKFLLQKLNAQMDKSTDDDKPSEKEEVTSEEVKMPCEVVPQLKVPVPDPNTRENLPCTSQSTTLEQPVQEHENGPEVKMNTRAHGEPQLPLKKKKKKKKRKIMLPIVQEKGDNQAEAKPIKKKDK